MYGPKAKRLFPHNLLRHGRSPWPTLGRQVSARLQVLGAVSQRLGKKGVFPNISGGSTPSGASGGGLDLPRTLPEPTLPTRFQRRGLARARASPVNSSPATTSWSPRGSSRRPSSPGPRGLRRPRPAPVDGRGSISSGRADGRVPQPPKWRPRHRRRSLWRRLGAVAGGSDDAAASHVHARSSLPE